MATTKKNHTEAARLDKQKAFFNEHFPAGTRVRFWQGAIEGDGEPGTVLDFRVTDHNVLCWLRADAKRELKCVAASHIEKT